MINTGNSPNEVDSKLINEKKLTHGLYDFAFSLVDLQRSWPYKIFEINKKRIHWADFWNKEKNRFEKLKMHVIKTLDDHLRITGFWYPGTFRTIESKKEYIIGQKHSILRQPEMPRDTFKDMWKTIKSGRTWKGEIKNRKKDGTHYWVDSVISPDKDINGNAIGYTALRHDITDKKIIEEIAITDKLTSLYNRRHFDNIFPEQIAISKRSQNLLVFVLIDIDHFKQYNDTYGHQAGDETLQKVAHALKNTLHRPDDYVFRLGGEEFGLVYHVTQKEDALEIANQARENVEAIKIEHSKNSASQYVTISSGLFIIEASNALTAEEIYKYADELLYKAKEGGRNQVVM